jgi:hypothetical protein
MGIDTVHDGLSQKKWRLEAVFRRKQQKTRQKRAALAALLALKPGR